MPLQNIDWVSDYTKHETEFFPPIPKLIAEMPQHDGWGVNPWTGKPERWPEKSRRERESQMAFEQKENTGALFKAKNRESERHPEYTGTINIDGKEYWLAGWVKESKAGQKYFSLATKPKDAKPEPKQEKRGSIHDMESDIPF